MANLKVLKAGKSTATLSGISVEFFSPRYLSWGQSGLLKLAEDPLQPQWVSAGREFFLRDLDHAVLGGLALGKRWSLSDAIQTGRGLIIPAIGLGLEEQNLRATNFPSLRTPPFTDGTTPPQNPDGHGTIGSFTVDTITGAWHFDDFRTKIHISLTRWYRDYCRITDDREVVYDTIMKDPEAKVAGGILAAGFYATCAHVRLELEEEEDDHGLY